MYSSYYALLHCLFCCLRNKTEWFAATAFCQQRCCKLVDSIWRDAYDNNNYALFAVALQSKWRVVLNRIEKPVEMCRLSLINLKMFSLNQTACGLSFNLSLFWSGKSRCSFKVSSSDLLSFDLYVIYCSYNVVIFLLFATGIVVFGLSRGMEYLGFVFDLKFCGLGLVLGTWTAWGLDLEILVLLTSLFLANSLTSCYWAS